VVRDQDMVDVEVNKKVVPATVDKEAVVDREQEITKDGGGKAGQVTRVRGELNRSIWADC
jgi:hypothetical protein